MEKQRRNNKAFQERLKAARQREANRKNNLRRGRRRENVKTLTLLIVGFVLSIIGGFLIRRARRLM